MKARYVYSACIVIDTDDAVVCCDPWFTPGIYDGSWYQYPPFERDPIDVIGPVDAIYVSHIHPDHYDAKFLRRYLAAHPGTRLLIGDTDPPHLARKMRIDGFEPEVVTTTTIRATELTIIPNRAYDEVDSIDTALVVRKDGLSVVNMNDNPIDVEQITAVLDAAGGPPTVAFLPYSGGGPYPQTYEFGAPEAQWAAAQAKREQFLAVYSEYVDRLQPRVAVPFAGKYWLGGPLSALNAMRGIPDAVEAASREPHVSVVLDDGGHAFVDLRTLDGSAIRKDPYDERDVEHYLRSLDFGGYDYERELTPADGRPLPLLPAFHAAYAKALRRTRADSTFWFCISTRPGAFYCFDIAEDSGVTVRNDVSDLEPRCEIAIDERYLFGLLTRLYHWNNAEIGSHYRARRVPDVYRRDAYSFLHYLQI